MTRRSRLKRLEAKDLTHPKAQKHSSFTGDVRRPDADQGFAKAGRVHSVEGTTPPRNIVPVQIASLDSAPSASMRDVTGAKPIPHGHRFERPFQPDLEPLKAHQVEMLVNKKKKR